MANNVIFKVGTKAVYDALQQKDANTLYWLTDVKEIRKGEELYAVGREATAAAAGLMSAADKAKLDGISGSGASAGLTPVDATIILATACLWRWTRKPWSRPLPRPRRTR